MTLSRGLALAKHACALLLACGLLLSAAPAHADVGETANYYASPLDNGALTIGAGQSLSNTLKLGGWRLAGIILPASLSGTQATLQMSLDGQNWFNVYDAAGNEYIIAIGVSRYVPLDPAMTQAVPYIRLRTGTSLSATVQSQSITITAVVRGI